MTARLRRSQRIRSRADFVRVQGDGLRVSTRHLLFLLATRVAPRPHPLPPLPEGRRGEARLGIVASRKVGGAVQRNRAKRLLREAFRLHPGIVPDGFDCVVIVRPGTHELGLADVVAQLRGAAPGLQRRAAEIRKGAHTPAPR